MIDVKLIGKDGECYAHIIQNKHKRECSKWKFSFLIKIYFFVFLITVDQKLEWKIYRNLKSHPLATPNKNTNTNPLKL